MLMLKVIFNLFVLVVFVSLVSSLVGCTTTEDVGCVPMYIGTGYDDEGMLMTIRVEEPGCPRIDTYEDY